MTEVDSSSAGACDELHVRDQTTSQVNALSNRVSASRTGQASNALEIAAQRDRVTSQTLDELEKRQDDVLSQLDELDQKLTSLLRGLGVTFASEKDTDDSALSMISDEHAEESVAGSNDTDHDRNGEEAAVVMRPKLFRPEVAQRRAA